MPGAVDTDMERDFEGPKEAPADVANVSLQAVEDELVARARKGGTAA